MPKKDSFEVSGPTHLTSINWNCPNYQRSVAASLVQGVYVLERDRQKDRKGSEALALSWYQHFHFKLIETLLDDKDSSIFGAVYEYSPMGPLSDLAPHYGSDAPSFILAFRGTLLTKKNIIRDIKLDLGIAGIVKNRLGDDNRVKYGLEVLDKLVNTYGHQKIWLTGHSLGAAIAIILGKNMAMSNVFVKSFLFNPPYVSIPIEKTIGSTKLKNGIRVFNGFLKAGFVSLLKQEESTSSNDCFDMLESWVPQLFVNHDDDICCEYIGYYERREKMKAIGASHVEAIIAKNAVRDLVWNFSGNESEPLHSIPSAVLNVNKKRAKLIGGLIGGLLAHRICQWWQKDLDVHSRDYRSIKELVNL
ncbi:alpha/beta-Hydrolases superfamily protein [Rhynchospora pubera]|uniref:Alpha/beta-Hydrolases superfamily protein n=1 Tax=Rhynchospora pubera TaxID=906938 RepID=A0AAV8F955_9POAL|nr:alpha/beta-Hydrolases superfamily protein [Rhynchospora pubera]